MDGLISTAAAQTAGAPATNPNGALLQMWPVVLIFVAFYFMLIRPQEQTRQGTSRYGCCT